MIKLAQVARLRGRQIDYAETKRLKAKLGRLRKHRRPVYLTRAEFGEILRWKFGRRAPHRGRVAMANTDGLIRAVTGLALTITHPDKDYELELRTNTLTALRGVSVLIASAVLALTCPDRYAVIDFRAWRQLFGRRKYSFTIAEYRRYMRSMRRLAEQFGWPVQEVDHAIWEYDRRKSKATWP